MHWYLASSWNYDIIQSYYDRPIAVGVVKKHISNTFFSKYYFWLLLSLLEIGFATCQLTNGHYVNYWLLMVGFPLSSPLHLPPKHKRKLSQRMTKRIKAVTQLERFSFTSSRWGFSHKLTKDDTLPKSLEMPTHTVNALHLHRLNISDFWIELADALFSTVLLTLWLLGFIYFN